MGILRHFDTPASIKFSLSKHRLSFLVGSCFVLALATGWHFALAQETTTPGQSTPPQGGSAVLPIPQPQFGGVIGRKASESTPDFPKAVTAPKGAPNVLVSVPPVRSVARFPRLPSIAWQEAA